MKSDPTSDGVIDLRRSDKSTSSPSELIRQPISCCCCCCCCSSSVIMITDGPNRSGLPEPISVTDTVSRIIVVVFLMLIQLNMFYVPFLIWDALIGTCMHVSCWKSWDACLQFFGGAIFHFSCKIKDNFSLILFLTPVSGHFFAEIILTTDSRYVVTRCWLDRLPAN